MIQADVIREHRYEKERRDALLHGALTLGALAVAIVAIVSLFRPDRARHF